MIDILGYFGKKRRLKRIAAHYNAETPTYQAVLGDVLNASRPETLEELLGYLMKESGMKDGMKILDAGCGVCGPAIFYASHLRLNITAITISDVQYKIASEKIAEAPLIGSIHLIKGDYNNVGKMFPPESFDLVLFAESFCYAENPIEMLDVVFGLLKPGGILYMKDFFLIDDLRNENRELSDKIVNKINDFYAQNCTQELNNIDNFSRIIKDSRFEVQFIRKPLYKTDNYALYRIFQGMNDLGSDKAEDVVRTFDFFEIKAIKPL